MTSKKKIVVAVITATALTVGLAGTASAHGKGSDGKGLTTLLSDLVKKGTLTQAQVDAINAAAAAVRTAAETAHAAEKAKRDAEHAALEALIAKTIGVDAAVIKTRLAAGETLGAIAGTKKADLIAVLVADHAKRIDAGVVAGKLTAAQAVTLKAGLVAEITSHVDSVRGPGMGGREMHGPGDKDGHNGKGGHGPKGSKMGVPPVAVAPTASTASYKA